MSRFWATSTSSNSSARWRRSKLLALINTTNLIPEDERYSFIFQGNSQSLDHILLSDSLANGAEVDIVHVNTEFAETPQRASDHDPIVVELDFTPIAVDDQFRTVQREKITIDLLANDINPGQRRCGAILLLTEINGIPLTGNKKRRDKDGLGRLLG